MKKKPISLAERIRIAKEKNKSNDAWEKEKNLIETFGVSKVTSTSNHDQSSIMSNMRSRPDHDLNVSNKGPDPEQVTSTSNHDQSPIMSNMSKHIKISSPSSILNLRKKEQSISVTLSKQQTKIFLWLVENKKIGFFNKKKLSNILHIPYISVRRAINKLQEYNIFKFHYNSCHKLIYYYMKSELDVNINMFTDEMSNMRSRPDHDLNASNKGPEQVTSTSNHDQSLIMKYFTNSSSRYKKKTTTYLPVNNLNLNYWQQKGLTEKQLKLWFETANCDETTMLRYLSYCHFEMVDLGLEESKPIDNVFNWFFKIIEKTGGYPKPKGYKSFEEKRLEEDRETLAEQERIAHEQKKIYHKKIRAKQDAEFFKMLNNPESKMYQKCFNQLNDFTKKRIVKKSFEVGMRANFDKLMEED